MTIVFRCERCEHRYQVADDKAGQRAKCKECGTPFTVPLPPEISPAGNPIYRHAPREKELEIVGGDGEAIEALWEHYERFLGPIDGVFHELVSDLVHIDVHIIRPTDESPWITLLTTGMSDRSMTAPPEVAELAHAELMIRLPPTWKLKQNDFEDERHYWPIRLLKQLARLPHEYDTWLGVGHTIPNGDPPEPYAENTQLCCALLLPPLGVDEDFHRLELDDDRTVHFYALVPLYEEEMNFKLRHGLDDLLDRFDEHGITDLLRLDRPNACEKKRRRFWPFGR